MLPTGIIFNIQRFSIHDGPGIRTTVFLKGCPLRCFWCHNPEGLRPKPEIQFFSARCIGCGECVRVCPEGAQQITPEGVRIYDRSLCLVCGKCVETCYAESLQITGREVGIPEVLREVLADRTFYETSGGGVTLSGGEPLLQHQFSLALLAACKEEHLHTAVETTTCCKWEYIEAALPVTDLFMVDIKLMDPEKHRAATGVSNQLILENIHKLAATEKPILFRVPVVPGVNDTPEEIGAIAEFVRSLRDGQEWQNNPQHHPDPSQPPPLHELELLTFHRMATDKYRSLGLEYRAADLPTLGKERMAELAEVARQVGVAVKNK